MNTPHGPDVEYKTGYWWFFLAVTGGLSLLFNLWMAIDPPPGVSAGQTAINLFLGVVTHAAPVGLSALASHGFKTPLLGSWERGIIIALFLVFMAMSISTQAALLEHGVHLEVVWAWALPLAIDVLALLCLRAILNAHRLNKEAADKRDMARDIEALAAQIRPDIEADIRAEYERTLPALREDIRRDIWQEHEADIAARREALETEFEVRRIDRDDEIRAEEQQAAMERWEAAEQALRDRITYEVRKELTVASKDGPRRAINGATPKLTSEEKRAAIRQALLTGDEATNVELAKLIGATPKTVGRIKKELRAEMGWADDPADDADGGDDDAPPARLRAV